MPRYGYRKSTQNTLRDFRAHFKTFLEIAVHANLPKVSVIRCLQCPLFSMTNTVCQKMEPRVAFRADQNSIFLIYELQS